MNKAAELIDKCDEIKFDAKIPLSRVLTNKEMTAFLKALDNRLDPKASKASAGKILLTDDAFRIEVDNTRKIIFIDGDISVKNDIAMALKDIGLGMIV